MRAIRMPQRAWWARLVHTFWPLITHSSPSRTAAVDNAARSDPAPGSENSWHHRSSPDTRPGSQRCCCSSVPASISVGPAQPSPIGLEGRFTPAARNSSSMIS